MQELNIAFVAIGGLTLMSSLVAGFNRSKVYFLTEPMAAVIPGIVIGSLGLHLLDLANWGDPFTILEQFARLTVGLTVMTAALRLPQRYFRNHLRSMGAVLIPGMLGMWLVSGGLVYFFLDVPLWIALLVGAIVTPTDPVLAGTIVPRSRPTINRRVQAAASKADLAGRVYPHCLQATAASYHAHKGGAPVPLQALMGWSDLTTARKYVRISGTATADALR